MRIAYVSNNNPFDVNNWSGTPSNIISALQKYHEVVWVGGGTLNGAFWHHCFLNSKVSFNLLDYCVDISRIISGIIQNGKFDAVISSTYSMCSQLDIDIPLIAFGDLTYSLCNKYLRKSPPQFKARSMREEEKFLQCADAVIYSSEFVKISALLDYNISADKIHVLDFGANIPNPIDVKIEDFEDDICRLVFVGRNWERKGGPKVLKTFRLLRERGFHCNLTVVGCKLPDGIDETGIEVIPWLDKAKEEDVVKYNAILRRSHFMVLPTEFDAYGIVFCEASAYGVPSIAADVGGVSQPINEGVNGFLLPSYATAEDYADKIMESFCDKDNYRRLRLTSRHEYETRLNWEHWANEVTSLLEKLVIQKEKIKNNEDIAGHSAGHSTQEELYIPVYAYNLKSRPERLENLKKQFEGRMEFKVTYMEAIQHDNGAVGLCDT